MIAMNKQSLDRLQLRMLREKRKTIATNLLRVALNISTVSLATIIGWDFNAAASRIHRSETDLQKDPTVRSLGEQFSLVISEGSQIRAIQSQLSANMQSSRNHILKPKQVYSKTFTSATKSRPFRHATVICNQAVAKAPASRSIASERSQMITLYSPPNRRGQEGTKITVPKWSSYHTGTACHVTRLYR